MTSPCCSRATTSRGARSSSASHTWFSVSDAGLRALARAPLSRFAARPARRSPRTARRQPASLRPAPARLAQQSHMVAKSRKGDNLRRGNERGAARERRKRAAREREGCPVLLPPLSSRIWSPNRAKATIRDGGTKEALRGNEGRAAGRGGRARARRRVSGRARGGRPPRTRARHKSLRASSTESREPGRSSVLRG